jgi:hypothetical protein
MKIKRALALGALTLGSLTAPLTIADLAEAGPNSGPSYRNLIQFRATCQALEGKFMYVGGLTTGLTGCTWTDGSATICDRHWSRQGNCWNVPAKPATKPTINHDDTAGRASNSPRRPVTQPSRGGTARRLAL